MRYLAVALGVWIACIGAIPAAAQTQAPAMAGVHGRITDETGGALPGVTIELRAAGGGEPLLTVTDERGDYLFANCPPGTYQLSGSMLNFATVTHRGLVLAAGASISSDEVMHLSLNAEVVVIGKRTFVNLADAKNPAEDLVGIAQSASQGAITGRQLDVRPFMRQGEVLETVPGVIITQHSGEGKANQYFLRGFNLDHGTDFAMWVAGAPVNMVTHVHSQGYSDLNFLIPELVAGVQYSKGPYFADQGDFATAGSSNINYATELDRPIVHAEAGGYGFGRFFAAASPKVGADAHLLTAFEVSHNNGPWVSPDNYQKYNGVVRYSRGDNLNGFSLTGMAYHGQWNATQAVPTRAVDGGELNRFGAVDPTDLGHTYRVSGVGEWQHSDGTKLSKIQAFGISYDLLLRNNFTFYLDDSEHGDQNDQLDHRFVSGVKAFQKRMTRWGGRSVQNTFGVQLRNDNIATSLIHTQSGVPLFTRTSGDANVTTAGLYAENQVEWSPWLRTTAGLRWDGTHGSVTDKIDARNSGTSAAGLVSPKGMATFGPWSGTEFYVDGGFGYHSNDARGTTLKYDSTGAPADPVAPLVRGRGAEIGVRTVKVPHLQSTLSLWTLRLDSELTYNGDIGGTEPGPASKRWGTEFANYYSPKPWLIFDGDVSQSRASYSEFNPGGSYVP
jgi:outer membrane receptor protein involved in Fe transport